MILCLNDFNAKNGKKMTQTYVEIDLADLNLDFENPRLPRSLHHSSKAEIVNWMLDDASLIELMLAIATNGFFAGEPLLVVEENGSNIVVEGNRRLSSLILLDTPEVALKKRKSIARVMELAEKRPNKIPCIKFDNRDEINKYLGFRHITGIKEWSLLAKARYLINLTPQLNHLTTTEKYRELAKMIGSKSDYIRRLMVALQLFEKIEDSGFFGIPGLNESTLYFNYLMDSLSREHICQFIGVVPKDDEPLLTLNDEAKQSENFELLIGWFFRKNEHQKTVLLGDSSHLTMLNNVLADAKASSYFFKTNDINSSNDLLYSDSMSFHHKVMAAHEYLEQALSESHKVDAFVEADVETLKQIKNMASMLSQAVEDRNKNG